MNLKTLLFPSILLLSVLCISCEKEEAIDVLSITLPPTTIATEACFTPDCITLILAHPDDNFYYENKNNYQVGWYKNEVFIKSAVRLSCIGNGDYRAVLTFLNFDKKVEQNYTVQLGDEF